MDCPSILLLTIDGLRADHTGYYVPGQNQTPTPNIDQFADDSETAVFDGYANSPSTRWAFQTIFTGYYCYQINGQGIPEDLVSLPEILRESGFETGFFGVNGNLSAYYGYDRGFNKFYGVSETASETDPFTRLGTELGDKVPRLKQHLSKVYNQVFLPLKDRIADDAVDVTDEDIVNEALEWIRGRREDEPYFAAVHLMDPHTPFVYNRDHLASVGGETDLKRMYNPNVNGDLTDPEFRDRALTVYDAAVRSADEQVGRILEAIGSETAVILTADHGETFGEYAPFHTQVPYSTMTQVPLIVRAPEIPPGRHKRPRQHVDLPPTVVRAAGLPSPADWPGVPLQEDIGQDRPVFFEVSGNNYEGIRMGPWKLVHNTDTNELELYRTNFPDNDGEDVSGSRPERVEEMKSLLDDHLEEVKSDRRGDALDPWDTARGEEALPDNVEENLEDLGYL